MKRGEIWWVELPAPAGRRPVVLLSRNEAYAVRELVTVALVTTRIRHLPVELFLDLKDGMPKPCAVNLDTLTTIPKKNLVNKITELNQVKMGELDAALKFALGFDE